MKRVLLTLTGTVVGLVALLDFKSQGHPIVGALPSAGLPNTSSSSTPAGPASAGPVAPGSSSSSASSAAGTGSARSLTGVAVDTPYGIVQVQASVRGKQITNVRFLQLTAFDGRSAQINAAAAPILLQETISAQSAHIDAVSGATFTSDGYAQSLQSALDQAGIK